MTIEEVGSSQVCLTYDEVEGWTGFTWTRKCHRYQQILTRWDLATNSTSRHGRSMTADDN